MYIIKMSLFHFSLEMVDHSERSQSVLARGVKITEFSQDQINPQPVNCEETDILLRQYLSPRKLCLLSGVDDLEDVKTLELKVDTSEMSLGNFGSLVPNLWELKLSTSIIHSIRDLGSSLHGLNILWMSQCCLQDLDGIGSLSNLKELYLSFNDISEISSLSMLEYLEILDLECNKIDCISQIQYLSFCTNLKGLTLQGNPVCMKASPESESTDYNYRQSVLKCVPQLKYFDDKPISDDTPSENVNVFSEDWDYLLQLQQDLHFDELLSVFEDDASSGIRPSSAMRPATSYIPSFHSSTGTRPGTGLRPHSAMATATFHAPMTSSPEVYTHGYEKTDVFESPESISDLTDGSVFCGNPSKALRSRIKQKTAPSKKENILLPQFSFKPEHTFDELPNRNENLADIIKQLEEWKVEYEKCQKNIKESSTPQILKIEEDNIEECTELDNDPLSCLSSIDIEEYNINLSQSMSESFREESYDEDPESTSEVHHITSKLKNIPNCDVLPEVRKPSKFPKPPSSQQHSHQLKTRPLNTPASEKSDQLSSKPLSFKEPVIKNKTYSNKQEKKPHLKYLTRPSSARAVIGYANASTLLPSLPSISIKQKLNPSN
ncbi:leucine-rich repeat-containing protein 56 isoform X1 [Octopus bimaculoides]|nr:leucine-rich repeat-containing protein 56 isoform X1 [Octopus bimaculoides]|eukprot:XP_014780211.1 PREDICTED: leucine-rich repeat-containing protein 56-like isoform X1 [Octopus bimaculoides]